MNVAIMQKARSHHNDREGSPRHHHGDGSRAQWSEDKDTPLTQRLGVEKLEHLIEDDERDVARREWWKKTDGLETVEEWVKNYTKHPAGWAALLMMHGIPEVTSRLRTKVENFAIYSALFLASAIAALIAPPGKIVSCGSGLECQIRKRIFFHCLIIGVVSQILCIMLSMAFGNALNEAARDADVYRMFSPAGNAFWATKTCERAFQLGVAITFVAMLAAVQAYLGWEVLVTSSISIGVAGYIHWTKSSALFQSGSIVNYWRMGGGGKSDPYDLGMIVEWFEHRINAVHREPEPSNGRKGSKEGRKGSKGSEKKPNQRGCAGCVEFAGDMA